jgi:hypothetical protein
MPETTTRPTETHTPGPARPVIGRNGLGETFPNYWTVEIGNIRIADCFGEVVGEQDEDGGDVFLPDGQVAANARRLAACWNACEGLDTKTLEFIASIERPLLRMAMLSEYADMLGTREITKITVDEGSERALAVANEIAAYADTVREKLIEGRPA